MNKRSGYEQKDLYLFGVINDGYNPIFTKKKYLKNVL